MDTRLFGLIQVSIALSLVGVPADEAAAAPVHTNYAVLFSGGYDESNNHLRYYEETKRMWDITTGALGFDKDKVYVLFADGTNAAKDRTVGEARTTNAANWVNSDWSAVTGAGGIVREGSVGQLQTTMNEVAGKITSSDSFYFWAFNHGSNPKFAKCPNANAPNDDNSTLTNSEEFDLCENAVNPGGNQSDVLLTAWNKQSITDANFAGLAGLINAKNPLGEIYAFAQCFSGGMVDNLMPAANRFTAWAAADNECSFGRSWADAWADGLEAGLRSTSALGAYAATNDISGGGPGKNKETPGYTGYNHDIVTNMPVSAPDTLFLTLAGLIAMRLARRGRGSTVG